jgi:ABC-type transport system involved in multi-copper enzyme maturation permease subunit
VRLLVVEVRRLLARRFFRAAVLVLLLGVGAMLGLEAKGAQFGGPFVFTQSVVAVTSVTTVMAVLMAFLVGATAVGAEWHHGTLAALLLWEPRRTRVFAAKLAALLITTLALAVLAYAGTVGGTWALARAIGEVGTFTAGELRSFVLAVGRGLALAAAAGALGFAIALTARRTAAALGALMAYLAVAEIGLRLFADEAQGWLLGSHVAAWLGNGFSYFVNECTLTAGCRTGRHVISLAESAVYLGVFTVVVLAGAAAIFRRREVA